MKILGKILSKIARIFIALFCLTGLLLFLHGCIYTPARLATVNKDFRVGVSANGSMVIGLPMSHDQPDDSGNEQSFYGSSINDAGYFGIFGIHSTYGYRSSPESQGSDLRMLYFYRTGGNRASPIHNISIETRHEFTESDSRVITTGGIELGYNYQPKSESPDLLVVGLSMYLSGNNLRPEYKQGKPLIYSRFRVAWAYNTHDCNQELRDFSIAMGCRLGTDSFPVFLEIQTAFLDAWGFGIGTEIPVRLAR